MVEPLLTDTSITDSSLGHEDTKLHTTLTVIIRTLWSKLRVCLLQNNQLPRWLFWNKRYSSWLFVSLGNRKASGNVYIANNVIYQVGKHKRDFQGFLKISSFETATLTNVLPELNLWWNTSIYVLTTDKIFFYFSFISIHLSLHSKILSWILLCRTSLTSSSRLI